MKSPPALIYRYIDAAGAWECLKGSTLAFTPLSRFNDPFDTNFAIDLHLTAAHLRAYYVKNKEAAKNWRGGVSFSKNQFVEKHLNNPTKFQEIYVRARSSFIEEKGVACFSELSNDPLMWAHYADKHQGVVIGFNTAHPDLSNLRRVVYSKKRPAQRQLGGKLNGMEMRKSIIWRREQEWRLSAEIKDCEIRMTALKPIYVQPLSRGSFASVTFGCKTSQEFKIAVAWTLKKWDLENCELQEVQLCDLTYKLKLQPFTT